MESLATSALLFQGSTWYYLCSRRTIVCSSCNSKQTGLVTSHLQLDKSDSMPHLVLLNSRVPYPSLRGNRKVMVCRRAVRPSLSNYFLPSPVSAKRLVEIDWFDNSNDSIHELNDLGKNIAACTFRHCQDVSNGCFLRMLNFAF